MIMMMMMNLGKASINASTSFAACLRRRVTNTDRLLLVRKLTSSFDVLRPQQQRRSFSYGGIGCSATSRSKSEHKRLFKYSTNNIGVMSSRLSLYNSMNYFSTSTSSLNDDSDSDGYSSVHALPTVALLGPPNAGKSTLFNRMLDKDKNRAYRLATDKGRGKKKISGRLQSSASTSKKLRFKKKKKGTAGEATSPPGHAIVSTVPGTTRDRRECYGRIGSITFKLIDTAGVDSYRLMDRENEQAYQENSANYGSNQSHTHQLTKAMMEQTMEAAKNADLIFLLFDARAGTPLASNPDLLQTIRWLRKGALIDTDNDKNKIVLLANKLEGQSWDYIGSPVLQLIEEDILRLGLGDAIPISALHGEGMGELAAIIEKVRIEKEEKMIQVDDDDFPLVDVDDNKDEGKENTKEIMKPLQLAILGRPNVGKSTLVNCLLNQQRVLVGPNPGVTRDAIAVEWLYDNKYPIQIIDTAGIRKRSQRHRDSAMSSTSNDQQQQSDNIIPIEDMAVNDALRAMKLADVAVLVIDAQARMLQRQELAIADAVLKEGRALIVAANKMDLILVDGNDNKNKNNKDDEEYDYRPGDKVVDDEDGGSYTRENFQNDVREQLEARFPFLRKTPVIAMSSLTGECVDELMPVVLKARERWSRTISTGLLNRWLDDVTKIMPPPQVNAGGGSGSIKRPGKIKYILQTKGRPPTFLLFCNTDKLPDNYIRYLTRHFQDTFEMYGMEVRLAIKKSASENPFNKGGSGEGRPKQRKYGGTGIGGREARRKRFIQELIKDSKKDVKGKKKRSKRR